jgi:signal transduction histidine kinase
MARRLAGLPIRLRLTLAVTTAMAVAFGALGVFIYLQFRHDVLRTLDEGLRSRVRDVAALVRDDDRPRLDRLAQLYDAQGRRRFSSSDLDGGRLLTPAQARRAAVGPVTVERLRTPVGDVRVLGVPAAGGAAAVAESLAEPDRELTRLGALLLIAGPLALALAALAGHQVAGAALRPVDRMRARARSITERNLSERLPVPPANDEVGRLGTTLNELLARLELAVAAERRVVADASHELRTPLTILRTELQLALRGERDAAQLRAALTSALDETERLGRLADDLLVLARADEGALPLRARPLDVRVLLEERAQRLRTVVEESGRGVRVEAPAGAVVAADPDRAAQAVDNLALNAANHGRGTITLRAHPAGEEVELHVLDEGPGFGSGGVTRAFERFSGDGIGLGLPIVEAIAQAHGGRAGARDRPEGGADAWISLPAGPRPAG